MKFLAARSDVDGQRTGVMGKSKGGEAALLIASAYPQVRVVVVGVPSSVAWQGIDAKDRPNTAGSWSQAGKAVPFVPYDMSRPIISISDLYARSLAGADAHPSAVIAVERIKGPVMRVCGEADTLWPSCEMSDAVASRLRGRGFKDDVKVLHYANAGHAAFGLPIPDGNPAKAMLLALGGDAEGNNAARVESWGEAMAFLDRTLKP